MKKMITELDKLLNRGTNMSRDELKIKNKSTLMNASRCMIFEYLCHHPCSSVSGISKNLNVSESSTRWHLDKLTFERYVNVKDNGSTVFYPSNMINPDHLIIFRLLAIEKSNAILSSIKSKEGIYQSEISKRLNLNIRTVMKYLSDLEYFGIIRSASDGKFKRYYMTKLINELKEYYKKNSKHFKDYIIKKTRQDGLRPRIILSRPDLLRLKLMAGAEIKVLSIPMIPLGGPYDLDKIRKKRPRRKNTLISFS